MNITALLPVTPGKRVSEWADEWLAEIVPKITSVIPDNVDALRERNELLSSYMPTLTVLVCKYGQELDKMRGKYLHDNPKPDKGITDWRENMELVVSEVKHYYDMIRTLHEDIGRRLSVAQTNIRSTSDEVRHGVR